MITNYSVITHMGLFSKDYIIGLDIGSSSVKMAVFAKKESGMVLKRAAVEEFRMAAADETLYQKQVSEALKKLLQGFNPSRCKFVAVINCPRTAVKSVILPSMPQQELGESIRLSAKNYFPFPLVDALFDFKLQQEALDNGVKKYQLLVATTSKATIDRYLSLLGEAGVKPAAMIPVYCALQELKMVAFAEEKRNACFLDLGSRFSELVIFSGKNIAFARKIPLSGMDFTRALTGSLISDRGKTELTLLEAEKIKKEIGIPTETSLVPPEYKISAGQMLAMMRPVLEQLSGEIDRCFDYYREESKGARIDALYLFGGTACLKGLSGFLAEWLGIEVKEQSPWQEGKLVMPAQLACAVGAALTQAEGINLLPPEIKEHKKRTFKRAGWEVFFAVTATVLTFLYIGMKINLSNLEKKISSAKFELRSFLPQLEEGNAQHFSREIVFRQPLWEDVFKEISNIIPQGVVLQEVSWQGKQLVLQGKAVSPEQQKAAAAFSSALNKDMFKQVKLIQTDNGFELRCSLD